MKKILMAALSASVLSLLADPAPGVKVALEMWVKVEPKWMQNERLLTEMGYLGGEI